MVHPGSGAPAAPARVIRANKATETTQDESSAFKKDFQTVGRPQTTDHNINDEYIRDPPNNVTAGMERGKNYGKKEGAYEIEESQLGPDEMDAPTTGQGRVPIYQQINAEDTSVHPNNPVS